MSIASIDSSLMSRNFVTATSNESKYIKASRMNAQVQQSMNTKRQNAVLQAGIAACSAAKSPSELALEGKKAARQMRFTMQISAIEESGRNLKELKDDIEKRAKEAMENKDSTTQEGKTNQPSEQIDATSGAGSKAAAVETATTASQANVSVVADQSAQVTVTANAAGSSVASDHQGTAQPALDAYI